MKIRTQFTLLLAFITLIPLIVSGSFLLAEQYRSSGRIFAPGYDEIEDSSPELPRSEWNRIRRFISRLPDGVDAAVVDSGGMVLYSSIDGLPSGAAFHGVGLNELLRRTSDTYVYQVDGHFNDGSENPVMVITRLLKQVRYQPDKRMELLKLAAVVLFLLLLLCIVIVSSIVWSVSRSVSLLERETRRISEGNLDVEIKVRGSNEITSLTKSLNSMRLALRESQLRRSRFIMGISHDLRTPISLIKGYTEAIADGLADSPEIMDKSLKVIGTKIDQLEDMVDDLINFVRLDGGDWKASLKVSAIQPLLSSYALRLQGDGSMLRRNVVTGIDVPPAVMVRLDEQLFSRMLENLCGNALRYTADGGTVTLSARLADGAGAEPSSGGLSRVEISVADDGCGISEQDLPFIFDMFYRGSGSRREEGKGLGLAVVRTIADAFGWEISVRSQKDRGSVFTISVPVV